MNLPYPDLMERETTDEMRHIAMTREYYVCGAHRDPLRPKDYADLESFDCVVCVDMWKTLGPWDVD